MIPPAPLRRRLAMDARGMALVEFAILLPVMLTLFLGGFQLSQASACKRRVTITARTLSDLVSQYQTMTVSDVTAVLNASAQIMAPYDIAPMKSRVSMIKVDNNRAVTVMWSEANNDTALVNGASYAGLPDAMKIANSYYVLGEVTYNYNPPLGRFSYPMTFTQTLFMVPRKSAYVDCPSC
jgi:Flp pilus assembly protein TadG